MPAATTNDISTKLRLPTLPNDWMKRLISGSAPSPGRSNASGGASTTGTPWATSMRVSRRSDVAVRQLRHRQVGDHQGDDAGGHRQRQQRGDGLGDARPGERAHAAQQHDAGGAGHDHGRHQALRLPEHPGRGVGGKARLGREQEEDRHATVSPAATTRTMRLSKRRPRNVGTV